MTKHREYPIALRQTAVARVAAGESMAGPTHAMNGDAGEHHPSAPAASP